MHCNERYEAKEVIQSYSHCSSVKRGSLANEQVQFAEVTFALAAPLMQVLFYMPDQ